MDLLDDEDFNPNNPSLEQKKERTAISPYDEGPVPNAPVIEENPKNAEPESGDGDSGGMTQQAMDFLTGKDAGDGLKITPGITLEIPGMGSEKKEYEPEFDANTLRSAMGRPTMGADIIPVVNNPEAPGVQAEAQAEADKVAQALAHLGLPTTVHPNVNQPTVVEPAVPVHAVPSVRGPRVMG